MVPLASTAMLTSCMDPKQNALITDDCGIIYLEYLGINQSSVLGF